MDGDLNFLSFFSLGGRRGIGSFPLFLCLSCFFPLLGRSGEKEKGVLYDTMVGDPELGQEMVM